MIPTARHPLTRRSLLAVGLALAVAGCGSQAATATGSRPAKLNLMRKNGRTNPPQRSPRR